MVALATSGVGCATVLYDGPQRPRSAVAVITVQSTTIERVDDRRLSGRGSGARFEVLPGDHVLEIGFERVMPGVDNSAAGRSPPVAVVCVELQPGHTYRTERLLVDSRRTAQIIDIDTGQPIDPSCEEEAERPVRAAALAATEPSTAPAVPPAVDREEPVRRRPNPRGSTHGAPEGAPGSSRRPGSGLSFFTGLALGGEEFVKVADDQGQEKATLSSGDGVLLGLGGMVTPWWVNEAVGFGAGLDVALKYRSIEAGNGSASIIRYPLALTLHLLTNGGSGPHYFLARAGVVHDFGAHYSVTGFDQLEADASGTWGPTFSVGYYRRSTDLLAWDVMFLGAFTDHVVGPVHIDAKSFGVTVGLHLNL
jgi:hypothetical protein